jgi:SAM-dependent methyltransferase
MLGLALVVPLEEDWRGVLDAVGRRRGWPTSADVAKLAARTKALSAAYNDASVARAAMRDAGAARLGFAFARDVPKGAAAVRELVATGALSVGDAPLRVLDVGAGLGATTWGLARALAQARHRGAVDATLWDADAQALEVAAEIVRERGGHPSHRAGRDGVELRATTVARPIDPIGSLDALGARAPFDVVLVGHVLSELDVGVAADARVDRHAALVGTLLDRFTRPHGTLVVVEPALRDRTRHLHRVRDALLSLGATVFAPCLHGGACPALARESDWCHEDLPVDLPGWLVPVARAAGLRREGLSFSYLVVRKDGVRLADAVAAPPGAARLRVVSELIRSKGKRDAFVCGEIGGDGGEEPVAARVRATRLDRSASDRNAEWTKVRRGDVLVVDPPLTHERPRVGTASRVVRSSDAESR